MRHDRHLSGGRRRQFHRRRVACPECGETFTITRKVGLRRFKARLYPCPECGEPHRWGEFAEPQL